MPRIATEKQKCLSRVAYDRIKVMILQKELMPGQFINESQLQETLELEGRRCGRPCWRWHRTGW